MHCPLQDFAGIQRYLTTVRSCRILHHTMLYSGSKISQDSSSSAQHFQCINGYDTQSCSNKAMWFHCHNGMTLVHWNQPITLHPAVQFIGFPLRLHKDQRLVMTLSHYVLQQLLQSTATTHQHTTIIPPSYQHHTTIIPPSYQQSTTIIPPSYHHHTSIIPPSYQQSTRWLTSSTTHQHTTINQQSTRWLTSSTTHQHTTIIPAEYKMINI